jgi:hypothetical protein
LPTPIFPKARPLAAPSAGVEKLKDFGGISIEPSRENALYDLHNGSDVVPQSQHGHSLRRNAAAQPDSWRKHLSPADLETLPARRRPLHGRFYGSGCSGTRRLIRTAGQQPDAQFFPASICPRSAALWAH